MSLREVEPDSLDELNAFQRDLLVAISAADQQHGLGVKNLLEEHYRNDVQPGRLYPNLDTLVDKGLVEKGEIDRRTNKYTLTDRGRRKLRLYHEWIEIGVDD